MTCLERY